MDRIVKPTVAEMARRGTPYTGVLYAGLMIADGEPRLVEYNVRFGDPECQVLMMRLGGAGARPDARLRRGAAVRDDGELGARPRDDRGARGQGLSRAYTKGTRSAASTRCPRTPST
jgi:hypothetical protein